MNTMVSHASQHPSAELVALSMASIDGGRRTLV